jgi:hypothetical protein
MNFCLPLWFNVIHTLLQCANKVKIFRLNIITFFIKIYKIVKIIKKIPQYDAVILKRTLSGVGVLDTIGGYCLLLPYIGLVSPGAYKFNEEYIELNID